MFDINKASLSNLIEKVKFETSASKIQKNLNCELVVLPTLKPYIDKAWTWLQSQKTMYANEEHTLAEVLSEFVCADVLAAIITDKVKCYDDKKNSSPRSSLSDYAIWLFGQKDLNLFNRANAYPHVRKLHEDNGKKARYNYSWMEKDFMRVSYLLYNYADKSSIYWAAILPLLYDNPWFVYALEKRDRLYTELKKPQQSKNKEDIDYTYRNMIYRYVGYYYKRYIFNVFMNLGGFYLNQHYAGDPVATFVAVPKDIQKNSLKFVVEQLKNIDWIDRPEVVENLEFDGSKARQILKDFLSKADEETDLFSTRRISLVAYRDKGNYSPEEYLEDLYKLIWEPTIKGRNLTEAERVLQIAFLTNVRNTVDINGNRENASRYYAKSQSMLQESAELVRNRQGNRIPEVSGFGSRWLVENLAVDNPNHLWYNLYLKVIEQVKKCQGSGNADTKAHYDYLMFLINRSLRS